MTAENAVRKMSKIGTVERERNRLYVKVNGHVLSVCLQDGHTLNSTWHTRRINEQADPLSDYFPGMFWSGFNAAVKYGLN